MSAVRPHYRSYCASDVREAIEFEGPGAYEAVGAVSLDVVKRRAPAFSMGGSCSRAALDARQAERNAARPGPGAYNTYTREDGQGRPASLFTPPEAMRPPADPEPRPPRPMSARLLELSKPSPRQHTRHRAAPGPGAYETHVALLEKTGARRSPAFSIGAPEHVQRESHQNVYTQQRRHIAPGQVASPGPGQYMRSAKTNVTRTGSKASMAEASAEWTYNVARVSTGAKIMDVENTFE
jgi:hypothetical protein